MLIDRVIEDANAGQIFSLWQHWDAETAAMQNLLVFPLCEQLQLDLPWKPALYKAGVAA